MHLQEMIERLSRRADDSDLLALLATSREGRLYNAALARELRDVIGALKRELHQRQAMDSAAHRTGPLGSTSFRFTCGRTVYGAGFQSLEAAYHGRPADGTGSARVLCAIRCWPMIARAIGVALAGAERNRSLRSS
jgi:hypothetical protein